MVTPSHLRIGNWIHCKGSSHYGIVTGDLLALLEKEEKMRERFEYIELTGELLEAAGFVYNPNYKYPDGSRGERWTKGFYLMGKYYTGEGYGLEWIIGGTHSTCGTQIMHLHHFQNLILDITMFELPLPESAKKINLAVEK